MSVNKGDTQMTTQGNLKEINSKDIFKSNLEVREWLLENIKTLEDTINDELVNADHYKILTEELRPDILAESDRSHNKVSVKIQLNDITDEDFKNLLASATATNANKVVWIVNKIDDKTRAILDWMNVRCEWKTQFIVLKLGVYTIDNSMPAVNLTRI